MINATPISITEEKFFDFRDFSDLDTSKNADFLINSMAKMHALDTIRTIKKCAIDLLDLKVGDRVLEVGCGLGFDAQTLARRVGIQGEVVAIDCSQRMLTAAKLNSHQPNIHYQLGNAKQLEFPDHSFAASYADRLLVSQQNINQVFSELIRVTQPEGKICISDIDLGTVALYPFRDGITSKLLARLHEIILNKYIGRELPVLFKRFNLTNIQVIPHAYMIRDFNLLNTMINFPQIIQDLVKLKIYTLEQANTLLTELRDADAKGEFLYSITLFTVAGNKTVT